MILIWKSWIGIGLMMKTSKIEEYFDYLFPNPKCELVYHTDYELLIAIVLSAQSTDKRVNMVTPVIFERYPSLEQLSTASLSDLENIIYPVGSYHKKAFYIKEISRLLHQKYEDIVPKDRDILMTFPGVGRKTANVFLSEFYQIPAIAVDTHVERVSKRLGLASPFDDVHKVEESLMKSFSKSVWGKRHLQMVLFGRYYCKAVKPKCRECLLSDLCSENQKNL